MGEQSSTCFGLILWPLIPKLPNRKKISTPTSLHNCSNVTFVSNSTWNGDPPFVSQEENQTQSSFPGKALCSNTIPMAKNLSYRLKVPLFNPLSRSEFQVFTSSFIRLLFWSVSYTLDLHHKLQRPSRWRKYAGITRAAGPVNWCTKRSYFFFNK